jgi:uncharacterized NAD(P)/FAD-binding protein YdhS
MGSAEQEIADRPPEVAWGTATLTEPMASNGCRIAVIGAGFSGVLVALHLLWRCGRNDRIYLVERAPRFGLGLAYSTGNPRHLLNVRIDNMSAFADEPDHFARWFAALPEDERLAAAERSPAGTFVRRQVYGAYVQHLLEDSITRLGHQRPPVSWRGVGGLDARQMAQDTVLYLTLVGSMLFVLLAFVGRS